MWTFVALLISQIHAMFAADVLPICFCLYHLFINVKNFLFITKILHSFIIIVFNTMNNANKNLNYIDNISIINNYNLISATLPREGSQRLPRNRRWESLGMRSMSGEPDLKEGMVSSSDGIMTDRRARPNSIVED